jgi:hypothetical protein
MAERSAGAAAAVLRACGSKDAANLQVSPIATIMNEDAEKSGTSVPDFLLALARD